MNNTRSSNRKPEQTLAREGEIDDCEEQMKSFRKLPEPKVSGLEAHGGNAARLQLTLPGATWSRE